MNILAQELTMNMLDLTKRPLIILQNYLFKKKFLIMKKFEKIKNNIENKIFKLFKFAKKSPNPDFKKFLKTYS